MGSGFLAQGVVVCNRCDSGITLFAIQSATADQLIHVPLLTSICIYLHISNFCAHSNRFDFLEMFFFKRIYWRCSLKEAALVAM